MKTHRTIYLLSVPMLLLAFACLWQSHATAGPAMAPAEAYSRFHDAPILVASNPKQVGSLDVPAGMYVIFAKAVAKLHGGGGTKLVCTLAAGADFDRIHLGIDAGDDGKTYQQRSDETPFAMNVLHNFTSAGTITLKCSCDADEIDMSMIKITAMRVNSFVNTPQ